jgi:hypothetical protein
MAGSARDLTVTGDGRLATRADTSAAAIRRRAGLERISADEFGEHFWRLPADRAG